MWRAHGNMSTIASHARSLGLWLSHYESNTQESCSESFEDTVLADFDQYAKVLSNSQVNKSIQKLFVECEAQFTKQLKQLEYPVNTYLAHGDFHPGNFFIDGDKVTAIDFQQGKRMLNGYDALYCELNSFLSFGVSKYRPSAMKIIRSSFLDGYNESGDLSYSGLLKPLIVVRALVYLSTIALQRPGLSSYLLARLDMKTASSWLAR
jgi:Ser/Thr protein kinase RdoA (MazF antagonist)